MDDMKSAVDQRITWAREDLETAILNRSELNFSIALGKLLALSDLSRHFEFLDESALTDLSAYMDDAIDRFSANHGAAE